MQISDKNSGKCTPKSNKNIYINQSFCSDTTCSRRGGLPAGRAVAQGRCSWHAGAKACGQQSSEDRDLEAGESHSCGWDAGTAPWQELKARCRPCPLPTSLAAGPEVPPEHRNKPVLPGAGKKKKNPKTSLSGPGLVLVLNLRGLCSCCAGPLKNPVLRGEGSPAPHAQTRRPWSGTCLEMGTPSLLYQLLSSRGITCRGAPSLHGLNRDRNTPKAKQSTKTSPNAALNTPHVCCSSSNPHTTTAEVPGTPQKLRFNSFSEQVQGEKNPHVSNPSHTQNRLPGGEKKASNPSTK